MLALVCLLACARAASGLTHGPEILLPADTGTVQAIANDGQWTYASTDQNKLVKMSMTDVTDYGVAEIPSFDSFYTIAVDSGEGNIYVTAQSTTGAGAGSNVLLKVDKSSLEIIGTHVFPAEQNVPYATAVDEDYVYCGMYTSPGTIVKISKSDMTQIGFVQLSTGENDIRSLELDAADPTHLYANTNTVPGRVVKIDVVQMTRVASTGPIEGTSNILAGTEDESFLYVGTNTNPATVAMILKADMSVKKIVSVTSCGNIAGMANDAGNVYATCYNYPAKIASIPKDEGRMNKPPLLITIDQQKPAAISGGGDGLFVGTESGMLKLMGWVEAVDCQMSEWGEWSTCSATCNGGFESRTRTVETAAANGGAECPTYQDTRETRICNVDAVCPEDCQFGMEWTEAGTDVTPTCDDMTPTPTATDKARCACPSSRPIFHHDTCATATVCQGPARPCQHTTCIFLAGRITVQHHRSEARDAFHCHHTPGKMGGCQCLCHDHVGER